MKFKNFKDIFPDKNNYIIYINGHQSAESAILAYVDTKSEIRSTEYCCNDPKCKWISSDCDCKLIINNEDSWIYLDEIIFYNQPERSKRENHG